ncbi:MAG: glycerate kinase [Chthoniobacteraceae bacterium]
MRILVAPDKFKGSLSAAAAAEAIMSGWRKAWPEAQLTAAPIADGGEGFSEALCLALGGEWVEVQAQDPIGRPITARYAWIPQEKLAIIEMSEASGLWRLRADERDPLRANTYGTGQLIRHATEKGAAKILVGLGGSATTDGGIGMAAALGYAMYTDDGDPIEPTPANLLSLTRIGVLEAITLPTIIAACDVQNPLLGERGTAKVFSPQKGATPEIAAQLELGLENLADVVKLDLECDHREAPGAGAAGGIGFGLLSFCRAEMRPGFDLVADAIRLEAQIAQSDLVITGEGRLDGQTLEGKGPAGVAAMARQQGKPVLALAGSIAKSDEVASLFSASLGIIDEPVALESAMERGAEFLERAAMRAAQLIRIGTHL